MARSDSRATTKRLTVRDTAILELAGTIQDHFRGRWAELDEDTRTQLISDLADAARIAIDSVWDKAHVEGHGCKSTFCGKRG